jgi:hypothetical protein
MTVHRMIESKTKNSVKKKNSGNSVHQRIHCHVLSISKHIRLSFVYQFFHAFKLLSIVYKCTDTFLSTAHCILEPNVKRKYVQIMNMICNP